MKRKSSLTSAVGLGLLAALAVAVLVPTARGESKDLVTIQARILQDGTPLDGDLALTFEVYTASSGGSPIWTESQTVPVRAGLLAARLGAVNALGNTFKPDGAATSDRWVAIKLGGSEVVPRMRLTAVPYAHKADAAAVASAIDDGAGGSLTIDDLDLRYAAAGGGALAGDGLVVDGAELAVGAGDGIAVGADSIAVDLAITNPGLEFSSAKLRINAAAAGDGLTGGGGSALAVGAGTRITVAADAVSVDVSGLAGAGLEASSNALRLSAAAAGDGLTGGGGSALAVGGGNGITVSANAVAVAPAQLINGGNAEVEADRLQIDYTPENYTIDGARGYQDDDLQTHLAGIDTALLTAGNAAITSSTAVDPRCAGGRLSAHTDAVTTTDTTGSTLYYVGYRSSKLALYVSSVWAMHDFGANVSLSVSGLTADQNYDIFAYSTSGTVALEALAWSSHGAGSSARTSALETQDGVLVKYQTPSRRYLGTIRTISSSGTKVCDEMARRFVWNVQNRVSRAARALGTSSWTYGTASWRQAGGNSAHQLALVVGRAEEAIQATVVSFCTNSGATHVAVGVGVNSNSTNSASTFGDGINTGMYFQTRAHYVGTPGEGYQTLLWLEWSQANGTTAWTTQNGGSDQFQAGIFGVVNN